MQRENERKRRKVAKEKANQVQASGHFLFANERRALFCPVLPELSCPCASACPGPPLVKRTKKRNVSIFAKYCAPGNGQKSEDTPKAQMSPHLAIMQNTHS